MKKIIIIISLIILPLLFQESLFAESQNNFNWFWFFYEKESDFNIYTMAFRPFYLKHQDKHKTFEASLMPVVFWRYKTERSDNWKSLFGLIQSTDYRHSDGTRDYDLAVFPLLFLGISSKKEDRYLLIWPFGGIIKGKFAYDKITACIFPGLLLFIFFPPSSIFLNPTFVTTLQTLVYIAVSFFPLYAKFDQGSFTAHSIMWPMIMWGSGEGRREFRFFPFYSHLSKKERYDRYNVLLLFNYQKLYFRNDTQYNLFIVPIFGRKWSASGNLSSYTILWPFFSWGYNKEKGDREYNLPWPFVQIRDCEEPRVKKRIFFPFYGDYQTDQNRTFFVTPLYFTLKKKTVRYDSEYYICSIIFWFFRRTYHGKPHPYYGNSWYYAKLWPLFQGEKNDLGDVHVNILSLLPFRDREGYEKLYQPFWTLFEYWELKGHERRIGIFFRLFFYRYAENFNQVKIPMIITYDEREKRIMECTMIFSMFGYNYTDHGRYMRLFWVPIKIGESDKEVFKEAKKYDMENDLGETRDHISDMSWELAEEMSRGCMSVTFNVF